MIFNNSVDKVLPIAQSMIEGELLWRIEGGKLRRPLLSSAGD